MKKTILMTTLLLLASSAMAQTSPTPTKNPVSEPERRRTDGSLPRRETWETTCVLCHAQAACGFSCPASKRSSFFQSVKAMAAILRAKVSRAISGFIPFASKAT